MNVNEIAQVLQLVPGVRDWLLQMLPAELLGDRARLLGVAAHDHDTGTLSAQGARGGRADAVAGSRDDDGPVHDQSKSSPSQ